MASIAEEINQKKPFKNETEKLIVNLMFTAHWLESIERENLKKYKITLVQYNILRILKGQYPNCISVIEIKQRTIDKNSDVSRLVERLRKQGFAIRTERENDRRLVDISITEKGIKLLEKIQKERNKEGQIFQHIDEEDLKKINLYLDKLRTIE
ncbi:MAG: MarR family transcriptional regulator [Bacteroidetes bacterium]|nr:MAG: MarR family transcriptional regulator [Bacteroidota bacterium]TAG93989.1 MAG: MarR family transcriptional regulator [Bacteroidota bacterium]